jgi:hypothetical protein
MKKYHLNKKEILFWSNKARHYLNLPVININIKKMLYGGPSEISFRPGEPCINLVQPKINLICYRGNEGFAEIDYSKERLIFSIFHEFAHYFQYHYYPKWFNQFTTNNKYFNFNGKHHDKRAERNADKIALILFNKLYKNKE